MNRKLKHTIAVAVALSVCTTFGPMKYSNDLITKAYASSDIYLSSISVLDGDKIELTKSKKTYTINVPNSTDTAYMKIMTNKESDKVTVDGQSPEEVSKRKYKIELPLEKGKNEFEVEVESKDGDDSRTYTIKIDRGGKQSTDQDSVFLDMIDVDYGEVDFEKEKTEYDFDVDEDVTELRVQAKPEDSSTKVYIDGNRADEDDKYRKTVKLTKGQNTIKIDLEDEDDDDNTKTYTLNVYRGKNPDKNTTVDTSKFDTTQDEIYLTNIKINDGDYKISPNFNKKITSYTLDLDESIDNILIKVENEYDSNIATVDGMKVDSKNMKRVTLTPGKNVIEVKVHTDVDEDSKDYLKRIYTLTVYRGTSEGTSKTNSTQANDESKDKDNNSLNLNSTTTTTSSAVTAEVKYNQWVNVMGKWQYNDATGNPLKNVWFYDNKDGKTYYLQPDGNMATGWTKYDGSWYYLDQSGAKQTGWQHLGSSWYYLDSEGKMKTGWFQDNDGKWYYFYDSGAMAYSTTIDGCKLGSDGAWKK